MDGSNFSLGGPLKTLGETFPLPHLLFNGVNYCLECLRLVHREVSQNLTVQGDTLLIELTDKLRVRHTVSANTCVDTGDPQLTITNLSQDELLGHRSDNYAARALDWSGFATHMRYYWNTPRKTNNDRGMRYRTPSSHHDNR